MIYNLFDSYNAVILDKQNKDNSCAFKFSEMIPFLFKNSHILII